MMDMNQPDPDRSKDVEIRMLFERTENDEIIVERIHISKDAPVKSLCESILYAWGQQPNIDNVTFMLAQTEEGKVILTKPDLVKYVARYGNLSG